MPKFLSNIDLNKNELQNAVLQNLAVHPANPKKGQIYYNTAEDTLYQYNGIRWVDVGEKYVHPNHTGDVTSTGDGTTVIGTGKVTTTKILDKNVTNTKLADMAANTIKGVSTAGVPQDLTAAQVKTILGLSNVTNDKQIPLSLKGAVNGVAELGSDGKIPSTQLPSYVDDVLEYAARVSFPASGESGKIYIAIDTNLTYRWSGTTYVPIASDLALGETSSTAYRGDRGKVAYDHSQTTHARADATKVENSTTNGNIKINGTETTVYTHPTNHDDRYYTETEVDTKLAGKVDNSRVLTDVPAGAKFTDTIYTHPTTAGNKHIPAGGTVGQILKNTASGTATWQDETIYTHPNHTGDITSTGDGATVIGNDKVTNAKLANMPAMTIKGNNNGVTGDPIDLTTTQVRSMLDLYEVFPLRFSLTGDGVKTKFISMSTIPGDGVYEYIGFDMYDANYEKVYADIKLIKDGMDRVVEVSFGTPPAVGENYFIYVLATLAGKPSTYSMMGV